MSEAKSNNPEFSKNPELLKLLAVSEEFLGDIPLTPGVGYQPIFARFGWLLKKDFKSTIVGYKALGPQGTQANLSDITTTSELFDLKRLGLRRSRNISAHVPQWPGYVILTEYSGAHLQDRQVVPADDRRIYNLDVRSLDSEGKSSYPYESFLYSATQGLIEHAISEHAPVNHDDMGLEDILRRGHQWLSGEDVDFSAIK